MWEAIVREVLNAPVLNVVFFFGLLVIFISIYGAFLKVKLQAKQQKRLFIFGLTLCIGSLAVFFFLFFNNRSDEDTSKIQCELKRELIETKKILTQEKIGDSDLIINNETLEENLYAFIQTLDSYILNDDFCKNSDLMQDAIQDLKYLKQNTNLN